MRHGLALVLLAACSVGDPGSTGDDSGGNPDGGGSTNPDAPPGGLAPGSLDVAWMHGSASCSANTEPELQAHAYNATTHVFRQNKCDTFEAPFVYLLVGTDQALLLDSGATNSAVLRDTVMPLVGNRALLVAHTHAHGDHVSGDSRFIGQPNTTVVGKDRASVQAAFGIEPWPGDAGTYELGGRTLDVLGIPGHEGTHIAIYDRETGLLFTGDSLYPGLLFVDDWTTYRDSMARLAAFASTRPIAYVLGAHVEMTKTPMQAYPYGETYQPDEHVLQLSASHVAELDAALQALPSPPGGPVRHADFIIVP